MFEHFTVIPAIDLKGGHVVRLYQGDMHRATDYGADPAEVARNFEAQGAEIMHIVDLDGAVGGELHNLAAVRKIRAAVKCKLDVGGGLRTIEAVRSIVTAGADTVSIGSAAILDPDLLRRVCTNLPGRVIGSIDVRDGQVAIKGWKETAELTVAELIERFRSAGVVAVTVTDIERDGTQAGVDAAEMAEVAKLIGLPLIASGGVSTLDDIKALRAQFDSGVIGVIIGRALYEGNFTLGAAIAAAK
ncbi:MAG: 1-(5-phosphoribosyl)-5-[(5-phosphoribosylamino)methylideneamino]imidazole-4-carboxamide isomerase [Candidatus Binataceae bacterium]